MEYVFKILGAAIITFMVIIIYQYYPKIKKRDSIKRNFDSFDEFMDAFYKDYDKTGVEVKFTNERPPVELCEKCKQEKTMNISNIKDSESKINEHIFVEYFRSNDESWKYLSGREGYNFKCRKHNINVSGITTRMS